MALDKYKEVLYNMIKGRTNRPPDHSSQVVASSGQRGLRSVKGQFAPAARKGVMVTFEAVKKDVLPDKIIDRLASLIRERKLQPGDKLPPERELATLMQVSRSSLREALRVLASMNVVAIRPGNGTFITSLEPGLLVEHLDFVFSLSDSTFLELFEARKILEPAIAAIATQRITDEEITELERCLAKAIENVGDRQAYLQADLELHESIIKAIRNPVLAQIMASISRLARASRFRVGQIPTHSEQTIQDLQAIVMAFKARDPEAAREAMLQHLNNLQQQLEHLISSERPVTGLAAF